MLSDYENIEYNVNERKDNKLDGGKRGKIDNPIHNVFLKTNDYFGYGEDLFWSLSTLSNNFYENTQLQKTENYEILQKIKDTNLCYIYHKEGFLTFNPIFTDNSLKKYCPEYYSHKSKEIKSIVENSSNEYVDTCDLIYSTIFTLNPMHMETITDINVSDYFSNPPEDCELCKLENTDYLYYEEDGSVIIKEFDIDYFLNDISKNLLISVPSAIHEICLHFFNNFLYYNIDKLTDKEKWIKDINNDNGSLLTNGAFIAGLNEKNKNEFIIDTIIAPMITKKILKKNLTELFESINDNNINSIAHKFIKNIKKATTVLRVQISFFDDYIGTQQIIEINEVLHDIYNSLKEACETILYSLIYKNKEDNVNFKRFDKIEKDLKEKFKTNKKYKKALLKSYINNLDECFNPYTSLLETNKDNDCIKLVYDYINRTKLTKNQTNKASVPNGKNSLVYIDKFGKKTFNDFQNNVVNFASTIGNIKNKPIYNPNLIALNKEFGAYVSENKDFAKEFANYHSYLTKLFNIYFINNFVPQTSYAYIYAYNYNNNTPHNELIYGGCNQSLPYNYLYGNIIRQYCFNDNIDLNKLLINKSIFVFELFINNCAIFSDFIKKY